MQRVFALGLALLMAAGCESISLSPYVSPRVTGRVVAADTRQPLADVKILVGRPSDETRGTVPPKGGQVMQRTPPVETGTDGRFVLESERVLTPFGGSGWFSVTLTFEHTGYERFFTNYSRLNLRTNTWNGEPVLDAGDIALQPAAK